MGDTGVLVATKLSRDHEVIGVSTKPGFVSGQELGTRLTRPAEWRRSYTARFEDHRKLAGVKIVHGEAQAVHLSARRLEVRRADGEHTSIEFDGLVIASGTTNGFWRTAEVQSSGDLGKQVEQAARRAAEARSVAVIGGGPSGVNVASQIADAHAGADVRLFHSGKLPLPGYHPRTRARVLRRLLDQGVTVEAEHRAEVPAGATPAPGPGTVAWTTGQAPVHAELVVWAIGNVTPNTSWVPTSLLDDEGFVVVEPTLQVAGHPFVFAIGDVAATDPLRSSARNFGHEIAARNVRACLRNPDAKLRTFAAPEHRWGSILGRQSTGITIFTPRGRAVSVGLRLARRLVSDVLTDRLLYGGVRRGPWDDEG